MKEEDKIWLRGFFEGEASFSISLQLNEKRQCIIFRPYIVIASTDSYQVNYIKNLLKLRAYSSKKQKLKSVHKQAYSLNIQNIEDTDKILEILDDYQFKSRIKNEKFIRFKICFKHIKEFGETFKSYNDNVELLIEEKLAINQKRGNIDKNRYDLKKWKNKIKEHLN